MTFFNKNRIVKTYLLLAFIVLSSSMAIAAEESAYENLYIALETSPSDYPCILVDSVYAGKRKWIGEKTISFPERESFVRCHISIPIGIFENTYEACYLSGIRLPDHNQTTHSNCKYEYPNSFSAEVGKSASMAGINSITCSFVCKLKK
ncbi:MAG: hypothetical protein O2V44_05310 [Candidatus Bathyarchaeota archaeon]|nr:hypothetical protein [Candidatus Bathyarchaeota archaeon]